MADAGEILAGPIGREVLGVAQVIFITFACGSHVLTGKIAFDTSRLSTSFSWISGWLVSVTEGASCSVLWAAVSAIICLALTIPRTLNGISYLSTASFISILGQFSIQIWVLVDRVYIMKSLSCRFGNHDRCRHDWAQGHCSCDIWPEICQRIFGSDGHCMFPQSPPQLWKLIKPIHRYLPMPVCWYLRLSYIVVDQWVTIVGHVAFFTFISEMKRPQVWFVSLESI